MVNGYAIYGICKNFGAGLYGGPIIIITITDTTTNTTNTIRKLGGI